MSLTCSICAKNFSSKGTLTRHFKNVHKTEQKNVTSYDFEEFNNKCLEQDCNTSYRFIADLRHHLQQMHSYAIEQEILKFSSENEFQTWFKDYQESTNLSYVRKVHLNRNSIYFNCNRSGKVELKTHSRKRALKSQGSCKIGYNCISQIILIPKSDNTYEAMHYKTHYGHALQIQHVRLPLQTRIDVATKLTNGVSVTKMLDLYRTNFNEEMITRTNLITRKDINNIRKHIHYVHLKSQENNRGSESNKSVYSELPSIETEKSPCLKKIGVTLANGSITSKYIVAARKTIATEINKLQNNINECPDKKLCNLIPYILKNIKNTKSLLTCNNSSMVSGSSKEDSLTASPTEPANKKIKKQLSFFSTKKKCIRKTETSAISKPSKAEEDAITEKIYILSDHDYY